MLKGSITAFYASVYALFYLYLGLRVVFLRRKHRQDIHSGGNPDLARAIRTHANAAEYIPYTFLLLLCYELASSPLWAVHLFGAATLLARFLHFVGFGLKVGVSFGRTYGTILNYSIIILLSLLNIWVFINPLLV